MTLCGTRCGCEAGADPSAVCGWERRCWRCARRWGSWVPAGTGWSGRSWCHPGHSAGEGGGAEPPPPRLGFPTGGSGCGARAVCRQRSPPQLPGRGRPRALLLPTCALLSRFLCFLPELFCSPVFPGAHAQGAGRGNGTGEAGGAPSPVRCAVQLWGGGPGPSHPPRKELFPALPPSNPAVVMGIKRGVSSGVFGGGGFARFVPGGCEPERAVPRSAQQEEQSCELSLSSSLCSLLSLTASLSHGSHVQPPAGPRGGSGRCGDKACGYGAGSGRGSRPHFPTAPRSPGVSEGAGGCRELGGSLWSQRAPLIL